MKRPAPSPQIGPERLPLISSARELRLWAWTVAVVVGIYSTLGLARALAGVLRNREMLDSAFALVTFVIFAAIVMQGLRKRPGVAELAVAAGATMVYLLVFLRMGIPEERTHLVEYTVVALSVHEALSERVRQGRRVPALPLLALLITAAIGTLDECIQALIPDRFFDYRDIAFNVLAGVMAISAVEALGWARRWTSRLVRSRSG